MAREQGGKEASAPIAGGGVARRPYNLFGSVPLLRDPGGSESLTTVLVAFVANVLIAVAKSAAAVVTGSASLVAEAAHSWADSGNEVFLLIANRRARRPPDRAHAFRGRRRHIGHARHPGTYPSGAGRTLPRRVCGAGRVLCPGGNLVPPVGPAGQIRGRVVAAGSDRARDSHLRPHAAGGVRRGLRGLDRLGHRGGRAGRPSADRLPGAGRDRFDPGWRAAGRRRGRLDQP